MFAPSSSASFTSSGLLCSRAFVFAQASSSTGPQLRAWAAPLKYFLAPSSVSSSVPQSRRCLSTSLCVPGSKEQHPKVSKKKFDLEKTKQWIEKLPAEDKAYLLKALSADKGVASAAAAAAPPPAAAAEGGPVERPTNAQLYHLAFHNSLPFVGFGFLDNFIMIVAGDLIDHHIGVTFAISTMAAAALGNTISDVFGVGSAWYVEAMAAKLGASPPVLSMEQMDLSVARVAANVGRAVGVAAGCVLGMLPLLFM